MKTRLFIDTNVMLDLLGERVPYYEPIAKVATLADRGKVTLIASALSYSTVFYLLSKFESAATVREKLKKFRIISEIVGLDETTIDKGLASDFPDFEDALQYHSCLKAECEILVTRNAKDFKGCELPVMTADEYLISIR
jgi:predicted nucleic acid-binding protein